MQEREREKTRDNEKGRTISGVRLLCSAKGTKLVSAIVITRAERKRGATHVKVRRAREAGVKEERRYIILLKIIFNSFNRD